MRDEPRRRPRIFAAAQAGLLANPLPRSGGGSPRQRVRPEVAGPMTSSARWGGGLRHHLQARGVARMTETKSGASLADIHSRISDHVIHRLDQLLPWNWRTGPAKLAA